MQEQLKKLNDSENATKPQPQLTRMQAKIKELEDERKAPTEQLKKTSQQVREAQQFLNQNIAPDDMEALGEDDTTTLTPTIPNDTIVGVQHNGEVVDVEHRSGGITVNKINNVIRKELYNQYVNVNTAA